MVDRSRIGLADDHPIVLAGLRDLIASTGRYDVVGTGSTVAEAVALAERAAPDLLMLDLNMPGDVLLAVQQLAARADGPRLLIFTASDRADDCCNAMMHGAHGYVLKGSNAGELFHAIEVVLQGREFISSAIAAQVMRRMQAHNAALQVPAAPDLSHREAQIVTQLLKGASNREIAERLRLSEKTVKYYMTQIMQKFDARNRVEVALAVQRQTRN